MSDALRVLGDTVDLHESGYATDRRYPTIHVLPEDMEIDLEAQVARWSKDGKPQSVRVLPGHTYVHPSSYKVRLNKHEKAPTWRLIGTVPEGTFVHKPCTVSGGGKSEISKSLDDAVIYGPIYTSDFEQDMDLCESILERDYSAALRKERRGDAGSDPGRPLLSEERSLGSVIKLLTPNPDLYTDEHNDYIRAIPNNVRVKRLRLSGHRGRRLSSLCEPPNDQEGQGPGSLL